MKKRSIALLVALSLCVGSAVGGTLAWLKASTSDVVNTFTIGDINIDLNEHKYDASTGNLTEEVVKANTNYKYVPGATLKKDPYVTVTAGSEACWLFVKVTPTNNTINSEDVIIWSVNDNNANDDADWAPVPNVTNVWYRQVSATEAAAGATYQILTNNKVTVNSDITKNDVANLDEDSPTTLAFTAYAVQSDNLKDSVGADVTSAEVAWSLAQ